MPYQGEPHASFGGAEVEAADRQCMDNLHEAAGVPAALFTTCARGEQHLLIHNTTILSEK
jgi:hypothetical protein